MAEIYGTAALALANTNASSVIKPIEYYAKLAGYTLNGDGVTDDSAGIMAAHTQAVAVGAREVFCAKQYAGATAYNIGQVLWRGPGAFVGTYRTRVIPYSARAMVGRLNTINPAIHLRKAAKSSSVNVLIWGDSTGTYNANHVSESELIWTLLQKAILRDNPGRTINFINRSIGGSDITQYSYTGTALVATGITLPSWFTPTTAPWTGFVANQAPDLIIVNWGQNAPTGMTPSQLSVLITYINTLTKVPDVLFMTNTVRSTQADSGSAEYAALEGRDNAAGAVRSFAQFFGYGLIDMHRASVIMRDGQDPCAQLFTDQIGPGGSTVLALPAAMATTGGDFDLIFTIDNTGGQAFGSGQHLWVQLSQLSSNVLQIAQSGSYIQLVGYSGGGGTFLGATVTNVAMPTGILTVEVAARGNMLSIYLQGSAFPYLEMLYLRTGGQFQPTISYSVGSGPANITITYYANSSPMTVQPAITDAEMFGTNTSGPATGSSGANGGNAANHPASQAYETVHDLVIDDCNFCLLAAGTPTQSIASAAAINPDCGLVKLTGPASGAYAITLAAPRLQDQGRVIAIEMESTTGTDAVTLASTNTTGGTATTTYTWSAANQQLILIGGASAWIVLKQNGVVGS